MSGGRQRPSCISTSSARRSFAMGALVSFAYGFGLYASTYLIPVFLQAALGFPATAAGLSLLPSGIALAITIPLAGMLTDRYSPRAITAVGLSLFCASFLLLATAFGLALVRRRG